MAAPPPALPGELVEEILLRLLPEDPACLLRASLVCKDRGNSVSGPGFRRRLHELHGAPSVLGLLHGKPSQRFIPTTASPFFLATPDHRSRRSLDCRHGRALFLQDAKELLVWEPITGSQWRVPLPAAFKRSYSTAAVFRAADGCDHRDCLGCLSRVLFVFSSDDDDDGFATSLSACLYSSETRAWGS
ncbi:unnamed protein product [Triticum turgidum subsp. durum]|uniref:F-box domain-containing protein n=1 Tax=Triticum turgidum subsp. durum TaxID=4567 RepID=A0A9R1RF98_TRITD|nr:unnamed protein product [Triticum turgidum subsp. durum]